MPDLIEFMMCHGADPNIKNIALQTAREVAKQKGLEKYLKCNKGNYDGDLRKILSGNYNPFKIRTLIKQGADLNVFDETGYYTPLMIAVMEEDIELASFLKLKGADAKKKNSENESAISMAKENYKMSPNDESKALLDVVTGKKVRDKWKKYISK